MFLADCSDPAITLQPCKPFLAMDGTGTYGVQFRDVFVPDELILAEPAGPFVKKIRAGFILLQTGMALGLIQDCISIMDEVEAPLGHVNRYLPQQPVHFRDLARRARDGDDGAARAIPTTPRRATGASVIALRLRAGEASVAAAHAAMLHCGARGYLEEPPRPAPPSRGLFRRHRHARHQAASQDAAPTSTEHFRSDPTSNPQPQQERPAMTDVLITAGELADLL